MSAQARENTNKWLRLALIFGAVALIVLVFLGTWQVQRLGWKEALLATIEERTKQSPVRLADVVARLEAGEEIEYYPVSATGIFDHQNEQHFFATFDGISGYYLYTPLRLQDGKSIFVNRGFIPYDKKGTAERPESLIEGQVTVTGLSRSAPRAKAGWVVPENDVVKNVFHWKDISAMRERAGLAEAEVVPMFIDQDNAANPNQLPIGSVTMINLPNNHLQYAITWYGLALTLIGVLSYYVIRHRRQAG